MALRMQAGTYGQSVHTEDGDGPCPFGTDKAIERMGCGERREVLKELHRRYHQDPGALTMEECFMHSNLRDWATGATA